MSDTKRRAVAERVFNRNQRRETEINDALKQEAVRHAAVIENMHRLRPCAWREIQKMMNS